MHIAVDRQPYLHGHIADDRRHSNHEQVTTERRHSNHGQTSNGRRHSNHGKTSGEQWQPTNNNRHGIRRESRMGYSHHVQGKALDIQGRENHFHPRKLDEFPWSRDDMIAKVIESRKDGRFCTTKLHQGDAMYTNNVYERLLKVHPNPADFVLFYTILVSRKHIMSLEEIKYAVDTIKVQMGNLRQHPLYECNLYNLNQHSESAKRWNISQGHQQIMECVSTVFRYQVADYFAIYWQMRDIGTSTVWQGTIVDLQQTILRMLAFIADVNRYTLMMLSSVSSSSNEEQRLRHSHLAGEYYRQSIKVCVGLNPLLPLVLGMYQNLLLFLTMRIGSSLEYRYNRTSMARMISEFIGSGIGACGAALAELNSILTDSTGNTKLPDKATIDCLVVFMTDLRLTIPQLQNCDWPMMPRFRI